MGGNGDTDQRTEGNANSQPVNTGLLLFSNFFILDFLLTGRISTFAAILDRLYIKLICRDNLKRFVIVSSQ